MQADAIHKIHCIRSKFTVVSYRPMGSSLSWKATNHSMDQVSHDYEDFDGETSAG